MKFEGYKDSNESVGNYPEWGLNRFTFLNLKASSKIGKEKDRMGIEIELKCKDGTFFASILGPDKNDGENEQKKQLNASVGLISNIVSLFKPEAEIVKVLGRKFNDWKEYMLAVNKLLPKTIPTKSYTVFLEWQWQVRSGKDKTYLQVPKNANGRLIYSTVGIEGYKMVEVEDGIEYRNSEDIVHPIKRDGWYMNTPWANRKTFTPEPTEPKESGFAGLTPETGDAVNPVEVKASGFGSGESNVDSDDLPF